MAIIYRLSRESGKSIVPVRRSALVRRRRTRTGERRNRNAPTGTTGANARSVARSFARSFVRRSLVARSVARSFVRSFVRSFGGRSSVARRSGGGRSFRFCGLYRFYDFCRFYQFVGNAFGFFWGRIVEKVKPLFSLIVSVFADFFKKLKLKSFCGKFFRNLKIGVYFSGDILGAVSRSGVRAGGRRDVVFLARSVSVKKKNKALSTICKKIFCRLFGKTRLKKFSPENFPELKFWSFFAFPKTAWGR